MKKCSDIEQWLPFYAEGILSAEEKRAVDEHLAQCASCRTEMAYLQKSGDLIRNLPPVEQPPWFAQKIMASVRREAAQKKAVRKWFYPLRFKIPMQIAATIVIAVLAVYIYRSGDERVKAVLPGAPQMSVEEIKQQPSEPMPAAEPSIRPIPAPERKPVVRLKEKQDQVLPDRAASVGAMAPSAAKKDLPEILSPEAVKEEKAALSGSKGKSLGEAFSDEKDRLDAVPERMMRQEDKEQGAFAIPEARQKESYKMTAPVAPRMMSDVLGSPSPSLKAEGKMMEAAVSILVDDPDEAAREVEKMLLRSNGKKITRQSLEGKEIVRAEVPAESWKDLLVKLKTLGTVKEKTSPADVSGVLDMIVELSGR